MGAQNPSEALMRCIAQRNPEAFAKLLSVCAKASLQHSSRLLKR